MATRKKKPSMEDLTIFEQKIFNAIINSDCYCKPGDPTCEDWLDANHRWRAIFDGVIGVINERKETSNLVAHARRELTLLGEEPDIIDEYIRVIQAFADMGHSGGSAEIAIPVINSLLMFKNITPLTDDPEEWMEIDKNMFDGVSTLWQSRRRSDAFSTNGGKTYYLLSEGAHYHNQRPLHETVRKEG